MGEEKKESEFNREDSTGTKKEESYKSFTKDKRKRISESGKVEYQPGESRSRSVGQDESAERRHSYNPNFTRDNRLSGERSSGENRGYEGRSGGCGGSRYEGGDKPSYGQKREYAPRDGGERRPYGEKREYTPREGGERRPYTPRDGGERRPYGEKREYTPREGSERRPYTPRDGGERRPYGEKREYTPREGSERRPYTPREGSERRPYGEKREYTPREGGERHPYTPREGSERRPYGEKREYTPREGSERRPYTPREGSERRPYGEKREYTPHEGGERRPYGEKREYTPREGGERRPYAPREGSQHDAGRGYASHESGAKRPYGENSKFGNNFRSGGKPSGYDRGGGKPAGYGAKGGAKPFGAGHNNKGGVKKERTQRFTLDNYPTFPAPPIEDKIRLNRYISMSGICSRREADQFITSGLVTVNGVTITELGSKVSADDVIKFNDNLIRNEKKVYIVMNKPKGYVTSVEDPHTEKTVMELLNNGCKERVYPVGRLDKNSLGVLLITNDGDLAKKLTHPSFEKKKVYQVTLDKPLTRADLQSAVDGITLDDGEVHADAISYVGEKKNEVGIEIHSGRNRIVRRIFEHLGYRVQKLDRVYFAGLTKQKLKRGTWRFLTSREVQNLLSGQYE